MSANVKIGTDTIQNANSIRLESADQAGTYVTFQLPDGNQDITTLNEYDVSAKATARISATERAKIIPENIKKDITVLGVTGTHEGGGGQQPTLFAPVVNVGLNEITWANDTRNGGFNPTITALLNGVSVTSPLAVTENNDGQTLVVTASATNFTSASVTEVLEYIAPVDPDSRGQIISMNLDGTARNYRILAKTGNIAEVFPLNPTWLSTMKYDADNDETYEGSDLDTYLNTTWYNTLTATAKAAIVDKIISQEDWMDNGTGSPIYTCKQGRYANPDSWTTYTISTNTLAYGNVMTRHVYAPSMKDIVDYLLDEVGGEEINPENIRIMIANDKNNNNNYTYYLRATMSAYSKQDWAIGLYYGNLERQNISSVTNRPLPAFQIDLTKIEWTPVTT